MLETNKVMFEIYRDRLTDEYHAVYFTELNDHTRDREIDKALAGDHFYDGFIKEFKKETNILDLVLLFHGYMFTKPKSVFAFILKH